MTNVKIIAPWMLLSLFILSPTTETMYAAGLPNLSAYFDIQGNVAQLTSAAYFLGFAFGILSLGRISDTFGRRPTVLFGLMLYFIASFVAIFAANIETLMFLRFCQAFGCSVGSVIAQAMARDSYEGTNLSYVYASLSVWLALIPALGLLMGGYIVEYFNWQYIFVFFSGATILLFIVYYQVLPETNRYINFPQNSKYFTILKMLLTDKMIWLYALIVGAFNGMTYGFLIEAPFIFIDGMGLAPSFYGKLFLLLCMANICGGML